MLAGLAADAFYVCAPSVGYPARLAGWAVWWSGVRGRSPRRWLGWCGWELLPGRLAGGGRLAAVAAGGSRVVLRGWWPGGLVGVTAAICRRSRHPNPSP